ncbi:MAG: TonB-dependent receptor [Crocinitomicaceae bacterium]|nr:TonB-dependent receptor [Crocinitomicaceae bacterium]
MRTKIVFVGLLFFTCKGLKAQDVKDTLKISNYKEVVVQTDKKNLPEVGKLRVKALDNPVVINSVNAKVIGQRNVSSLGDAAKSATGVRPINRYGGFQTFRVRGFNNFVMLVDGVRDERHNISTSAPSTNLANVERIEVLKGPASVLYGHSALGGIINIVRKKPTYKQKSNFKASYGSYNSYEMTVGNGGSISKNIRYRVDFGITRSDGWRDYGVETNNLSVMFDFTPTKKDRFELYIQGNNDLYDTDTGIPVDEDGNIIPGMNPETRYNDPQDYLKHKRADFQLKYTHMFNSNLKISNLASWSFDDIDYLSTEWLYFNATQDSITRGFPFYFNHVTKPVQNQFDLTYSFSTGNIEHKALVGHSFSYLDRKTFRGGVTGPGAFTTVSVVNPTLNQGHIEAYDDRVQVKEEMVNGFFLQDWIKVSNKIKALIGLRYDIFNGTYYTDDIDVNRNIINNGEKTEIPSTALTYRAGLVYQPIKDISLFGSYSNYFKPSRRIANDGTLFNPETGYQTEGGIKFQKGAILTGTVSTFYILKNNIVEKTTANEFKQIGSADSKGFEIDLESEPLKGLYIKAGYAFTDARVRAYELDSLQKINSGNKLRFAPEHMVNVWMSYEFTDGFVKGLGVGAGMNYVSDNYTDSDNTYSLPAYGILDATIFYQANRTRIGLNVNNVLDALYFTDAIYGNQFFLGQGRNIKLSFSYKI